MVIQKTAVYKVLAIVLVFLVWWGSVGRVAAAPQDNYIYRSIGEYHANGLNSDLTYYEEMSLSYSSENADKIKSFIYHTEEYPNDYFVTMYSYEKYSLTLCQYKYSYMPDGTVKSVSLDNTLTKEGIPIELSDGSIVYIYIMQLDVKKGNDNAFEIYQTMFNTNVYTVSSLSKDGNIALNEILVDKIEPEITFKEEIVPDWKAATNDPLLQLNNFQAEIVEDNLVMKWDPITYLPYRTFENMYIRFRLKQRPNDSVYEGNNQRNNLPDIGYCKMSDLGITIPLDDLNISENYILSSVTAVPYYYVGDDPENELKKGNSSYVAFDNDGISSNPIIVDPDIDPDVEQEKVEQNIFNSIQNFFSGFFRNLMNTIKSAVVPESADVLALLQEMNDWFSERFGFIWYPFDLAIDMMAAFALGEPDSKITIPALTLNMFGGVKLWDEFQADLDPIDFLKYVRFFTSVIMCCGTVSLAIRKWDEWIGGEH